MERPESAVSSKRHCIIKRTTNITFKNDTDFREINEISKFYMNLIKSPEWRFCFKEYQTKHVKRVFKQASVILITDLTLHFCKAKSIFKEISEISFPRLISLDLPGNHIASLQQLQTCNLQSLQRLNLRQNNLTSLRSLRKCNFKLKVISLSDNKIMTFDELWGELDFSNLTELELYNNQATFNLNIVRSQINLLNLTRLWASGSKNFNELIYLQTLHRIGVPYPVVKIINPG